MKPVFLIGFMCSGKSTLGHALSQRLGFEFIDLDHYIEHKASMSVRQIFDEMGEGEFRRLEKEALAEVCNRHDVIVACGGGTPCQPGAMDLMNTQGLTVRLQPSEYRLVRRLMSGRHKRPLLAGINDIDEMRDFMIFTQAKREADYCKAQCRFDSSYLENPKEIAETVEKFITQVLNNE